MTICENKKKAVAKLNWTKTIARSTQSLQRSYVVIAHDVRMRNVNVINQSQTIKDLTIQNVKIHKNLKITKIVWLKKIIEAKKTFFSLIIEINFSETTNRLIKKNIVENHELKICKYFNKKNRLTQCFNCQQYEYINKVIKNVIKYDYCAENHFFNVCDEKRKYCAVCKLNKHEVWLHKCKKKTKNKNRDQSKIDRTINILSKKKHNVDLKQKRSIKTAK